MDSPSHKRGRLKMYLGFAAGVGKTYQMLTDAHELVKRGVDVVIGYLEPHGRKDTIAQAQGLELIPRCKMEYRGAVFEEMDLQAILDRHPEVCVVDELPHTNVPGCTHLKRWARCSAAASASRGGKRCPESAPPKTPPTSAKIA